MSDPTTPDRPTPEAPTPTPDGTSTTPAGPTTTSDPGTSSATPESAGSTQATDDTTEIPKVENGRAADGAEAGKATAVVTAEKKKWWRRRVRVRGPWVTVVGALVVLIVLALLGYVWGLGPLNRLNAERGIAPPAKLAGLDRITDPEIRSQAQLDQTRDALSRINDGKKVTVEAYGSLEGDRFYVLIALRGKVDIDKTVADSGARSDQIKKIGRATCVETGNLPTQCYLSSNALTVILQSANDGVTVDQVAPVAEEAFNSMK